MLLGARIAILHDAVKQKQKHQTKVQRKWKIYGEMDEEWCVYGVTSLDSQPKKEGG